MMSTLGMSHLPQTSKRACAKPSELRLNLKRASLAVHPSSSGDSIEVLRTGSRYAQALLEREMAALGLQQAMWSEEARESAVQGSAAANRLAAAQAELADADAELNHVQLEGPANHRKRDPIDKVCATCISRTCSSSRPAHRHK